MVIQHALRNQQSTVSRQSVPAMAQNDAAVVVIPIMQDPAQCNGVGSRRVRTIHQIRRLSPEAPLQTRSFNRLSKRCRASGCTEHRSARVAAVAGPRLADQRGQGCTHQKHLRFTVSGNDVVEAVQGLNGSCGFDGGGRVHSRSSIDEAWNLEMWLGWRLRFTKGSSGLAGFGLRKPFGRTNDHGVV